MAPLTMKTLTESDTRFIERMGQLAQSDGLSRIGGEIWAVLIVSDDPVSSSELVGLLRVSKTSVSTNTCFLERLGIVERRSALGERQDFFNSSQPLCCFPGRPDKKISDRKIGRRGSQVDDLEWPQSGQTF